MISSEVNDVSHGADGEISISSGLTELAKEVALCTGAEAAYSYLKERQGVPNEVAIEFYEKFGNNGALTTRAATEKFYNFAKSQGWTDAELKPFKRKGQRRRKNSRAGTNL